MTPLLPYEQLDCHYDLDTLKVSMTTKILKNDEIKNKESRCCYKLIDFSSLASMSLGSSHQLNPHLVLSPGLQSKPKQTNVKIFDIPLRNVLIHFTSPTRVT